MLEQMLRLYTMFMATGATSPLPHFVGPPGSGKSTVARQLADTVGVKLHTINVSRISPLELEGVQMPDKEHGQLNLLTATFWTQLKDGDVLLLDEFLRGFPEVYNGLLDILTAREVGGYQLPNVFIMAASNSTVAYDSALEDRLLHMPVPDPRKSQSEYKRLAGLIQDGLGLYPDYVGAEKGSLSSEMQSLLDREVLPTFEILDSFKGKGLAAGAAVTKGSSVRKLIGQGLLREIQSSELGTLIEANNYAAAKAKRWQYVVLTTGKRVPPTWVEGMSSIKDSPKLTKFQRTNIALNLQLIEMEEAKKSGTTTTREDDEDDDGFLDD